MNCRDANCQCHFTSTAGTASTTFKFYVNGVEWTNGTAYNTTDSGSTWTHVTKTTTDTTTTDCKSCGCSKWYFSSE